MFTTEKDIELVLDESNLKFGNNMTVDAGSQTKAGLTEAITKSP